MLVRNINVMQIELKKTHIWIFLKLYKTEIDFFFRLSKVVNPIFFGDLTSTFTFFKFILYLSLHKIICLESQVIYTKHKNKYKYDISKSFKGFVNELFKM